MVKESVKSNRCATQVKEAKQRTVGYMAIPIAGLLIILLLSFTTGLTGLSLFGSPMVKDPKTEGYITLPPAYITISDSMANVTWNNNGNNDNLTYIDNETIAFTIHDQTYIDLAWQVAYICDSIFDIQNATLSLTMSCNTSIIVSLVTLAQGPKPDIWWINQTLSPGMNTYNFTLIGTGGLFANVNETLDDLLFCIRNNMFEIRMVIPQNWEHKELGMVINQIVMTFYATHLSSHLYDQFYN
jgi:hypothetical protein